MTRTSARRTIAAAGLLAILSIGAAACGGGDDVSASTSASSSATTASIAIKDFAFAPKELKVKVGAPITVTNGDAQPHTATSDTPGVFNTDAVAAGGTAGAPITITKAGTYPYHCSFHPFMTGTIVVE